MSQLIDEDLQARLNRMNPVAAEVNLGDLLVGMLASIAALQGGGGAITSGDITDATAVGKEVLTAADAPTARTAIGAGTSSVALGTTAGAALATAASAGAATTAAKSDHVHALPIATALQVAAITTAGNTTIAAGSLQAALQAIANLANPAAA